MQRGASSSLIVTSPSLLFVAALELALDRLQALQAPLHAVTAISGSGQQHGSVFWASGSGSLLASLSPQAPLSAQLRAAFSIPNAPIWMDSSTADECRLLEAAVGGAAALAELTGSRAYERFTGSQICKLRRLFPAQYAGTERISLVSSFLACLLLGRYAPIDASDAAGMNLMNIRTLQWEERLLQAVDDSGGLRQRLGADIVPSSTVLGGVSDYLVQRWGFSPSCKVVACSGDNPCTLAGMELTRAGDVGVSLGTSDTLFAVVTDARPSAAEGHVFINPVDAGTQMVMAVFKNGSLTRQAVRDRVVGGDWRRFNAALQSSAPGNGGLMQFTFLEAEITPTTHSTGVFRFGPQDEELQSFAEPEAEVRAVVEGQALSLRSHARQLGLSRPQRLVASGGASVNRALLQVLADVFQAPVLVQTVRDTRTGQDASELNNTAALGAALRAQWAVEGRSSTATPAADAADAASASSSAAPVSGGAVSARVSFVTAAAPRAETAAVYDAMMSRFEQLERRVVDKLR